MPDQKIDPQESGLAAEWLLIMERLKVDNLAAWIAQYRRGSRADNPQWRSWESIARHIYEQARVTVSTNGLRSRWSDEVDAILDQPAVPVPPTEAAGSAGTPGGSSGSDDPPGSNVPGEATR